MDKQTAIQWLCMKLSSKLGMPNAIGFYIDHQEEIFEALEIEKEQNQRLIDEALIAYGFIKNSEITEKNGERTKLKTL
jgi:hypothetical protein